MPGHAKITASLKGESASATVIVRLLPLPANDLEVMHKDSLRVDGANFASRAETDVKLQDKEIPATYALAQNYSNPFNLETEIRFQFPHAIHITVKIFNTLGEEIRTLVDEQREAGYHRVRWDGKDKNGKLVASGVYLCQLRAGSFSQVRKMSLLR